MVPASLHFVTYIRTTADQVWRALTVGEITRRYWGNHRNASDWQVGSAWRHEDYDDPSLVDDVGTVIACDPPGRLVLSWADAKDAGDPARQSRVAFDIVEDRGLVRLAVTHAGLPAGSAAEQGFSEGWPMVLASLKSLLETGEPMPDVWLREGSGWRQVRFGPGA